MSKLSSEEVMDLLERSNEFGVKISLENNDLIIHVHKGKKVTSSFLNELKGKKEELIKYFRHHKQNDGLSDSFSKGIQPGERAKYIRLPLSYSQERLWFIDQLEGSAAYHIPMVLRLRGKVSEEGLSHAMAAIVDRHEVLRTVIEEEEGRAYQRVLEKGGWKLEVVEGKDWKEEVLRSYIEQEASRRFDLSVDYPVRSHLVRVGAEEWVLLVTLHHIASDEWSRSILVREFKDLYRSYVEGRTAVLPVLSVQYADYALWQRRYLTGEVLEEKLAYWRGQLSGLEVLDLPTDHVRPAEQSTRGGMVGFRIEREVRKALEELSRSEGVTLFMTLLAVFKVLLYRYSGQEDISVGSPIAGRQQQEVEGLIGFFVNTLVLRSDLRGEPTFRELLRRVKETTLEAYQHQEVPFEQVVEAVVRDRDMNRNPLFQVMLVWQQGERGVREERRSMQEVDLLVEEVGHRTSKFDITVLLREGEEGLEGGIEYCSELYEEDTIRRMIGHYKELLGSVVKDASERIGKLRMMSEEECRRVLEEFTATAVDYPLDKTVVDLIEEQAIRTPEVIAVVYGQERVSYGELEERSNQLTHYLRRLEVWEEVLVPVCLERSVEMIVGILGILKAGGAYVPLDPEYPAERLAYMLTETEAKVVVSSREMAAKLPARDDVRVVLLDEERAEIDRCPIKRVERSPRPEHLAYVIYTSGSTGQPKGVMIEHRGLSNRLLWAQDYFKLEPQDAVLQKTTYCFDVSVWELLWPLLSGARLVFAHPRGHKDPAYLKTIIQEQGITTIHFVPGMLEVFLQEVRTGECAGLRRVLCSGETLKSGQVRLCRERLPQAEVHNLYGPTEASIDVSCWSCPAEVPAVIPIGRPVANTQLYIVGRQQELSPIGGIGEICIGGVQLSRGYLGRPEWTEERFVPDVISGRAEERLYRTGDLGRWLTDGNIEYLGRRDEQVKIRGYRIELGEVESVLGQCAGVRQRVVVAREDQEGNKRLVGYVVPADGWNKERALVELKERLPEYMVPQVWVELEALPLMGSGKVDRKGLPEPELDQAGGSYEAPRTELEWVLAGIWSELLGVERIGIHDNFFELGGHSLLAMRVVSVIRRRLGLELSIRELFRYPEIGSLSRQLEREGSGGGLPVLERQERPDRIPLSFAQERLWFIDRLEGSVQYHIPVALRIRGRLDRDGLEWALRGIVERHEVLRTMIEEQEGEAWQRIVPAEGWVLETIEWSSPAVGLQEHIGALVSRPFALSADYKLRAELIGLGEKEQVLVVTLHHIASDGWSRSILVREFRELYSAFVEGREPVLPELPVQYADYALWQRRYLEGEVLDKQLEYWRQQLLGWQVLELPTDHVRPAVQSVRGGVVLFQVEKALSEALQELSRRQGVTLFMTLLSVFKVLLYRYSGQEDILVGSSIAGRQQQEVEGLVGFFANTLVLRSQVSASMSMRELLSQIKQTTLSAFEHQQVPFEKVVELMGRKREAGRNPIFDVMFVFGNTPESEALDLSGIELSVEDADLAASKFDLSLHISPIVEGLKLQITYQRNLFIPETMAQMLEHYVNLLKTVVNEIDQPIGELELMSEKERAELEGLNRTPTVVDLIEEQALRSPEAIAVVCGEQE
ncbi:non-ribosomal peptide synthetase, partial [Puia dinghuensis]|uniref:non-ribosomal peptide synthetase n=1 Tax=Puia dinghuensis TaxID=1792502 RepID=UPI0016638903